MSGAWDCCRWGVRDEDIDMIGPGHQALILCPHCHSVYSLELVDEDSEEMSEGQASDYEAGMWGVSICSTCGHEVDWDV